MRWGEWGYNRRTSAGVSVPAPFNSYWFDHTDCICLTFLHCAFSNFSFALALCVQQLLVCPFIDFFSVPESGTDERVVKV